MAGTLYIVSTPIGNLSDISSRAIKILKDADIIACEDSRHTKKLLNHYSVDTRLTSYHEHNELTKSQKLVEELKEGKNIALVSDAGTPCVSDPGYRIINQAIKNSIKVVPIPGPSSVFAALAASGLPNDKFLFLGFLPKTKKQIEKLTEQHVNEPYTLIFFESPKRIKKSLIYILDKLGNREAVLCRELTKLHEEIVYGKLDELSETFAERENIKGEITLVIKGYQLDTEDSLNNDSEAISNRLKTLKKLGLSLKDSVKVVCEDYNMPKKVIYEKALIIWDN